MAAGIWEAARAGFLSFASPCLLPILPFYLCYLGGLLLPDGRMDPRIAQPRPRLARAGLGFAAGVTSIFLQMGTGDSAIGQIFIEARPVLRLVAAALVLIVALDLLGPRLAPRFGTLGAYLVGLCFGFGWTPCIGPTLAAILSQIALPTGGTAGLGLLIIYGMAMTLPFVLIAAVAGAVWPRGLPEWRGSCLLHLLAALGLMLFAALLGMDRIGVIAEWLLERGSWPWLL